MAHTTNSSDEGINPYEASTVQSGQRLERSSFRLSATFVIAVVLTGGLLLTVLFTRSRFESIFLDFDTKLPVATSIALSPWTVVAIGVFFLLTLAKEFIGIHSTLVRLYTRFACFAALGIGCAYTVAIFLPLLRIGTPLS
jgi:hypothetical protein